MKKLRELAQEYIDLRRALGYKLVNEEPLLKDFSSFMERENAPYIIARLALHWAKERKNVLPSQWGYRLSLKSRLFYNYVNPDAANYFADKVLEVVLSFSLFQT